MEVSKSAVFLRAVCPQATSAPQIIYARSAHRQRAERAQATGAREALAKKG